MASPMMRNSKLLEIALRTLNAACINHQQPAQADEVYLRQISGDHTTSIDELACQIIESELRLQREARPH